jgi:hypothetical protein
VVPSLLLSVFGVGFAVAIKGRREDRRAPRQGVVDTEEIMMAVPRARNGRRRVLALTSAGLRRDVVLAKIRPARETPFILPCCCLRAFRVERMDVSPLARSLYEQDMPVL